MLKITKKERREIVSALSLFTQLGMTMACCILLGVLFGRWLDGFLKSAPWFLLVFSVSGFAAAIKAMLDVVKQEQKKDEK